MNAQEFRTEINQKIKEAKLVLEDYQDGVKTLDEVKQFLKERAIEECNRDFYFNDEEEYIEPSDEEKQYSLEWCIQQIDELSESTESYRLSPYSSGSIIYAIYND